MRGMGAGMRRARLGRERREWRCHPHLREETRPERGWAPRLGGARGTAGGHRTGHGGDTQEPRGPLGASRRSRPHGPDSDLRISRSPPAPRTPGWRRILAVPPPPPPGWGAPRRAPGVRGREQEGLFPSLRLLRRTLAPGAGSRNSRLCSQIRHRFPSPALPNISLSALSLSPEICRTVTSQTAGKGRPAVGSVVTL